MANVGYPQGYKCPEKDKIRIYHLYADAKNGQRIIKILTKYYGSRGTLLPDRVIYVGL